MPRMRLAGTHGAKSQEKREVQLEDTKTAIVTASGPTSRREDVLEWVELLESLSDPE